MTAKNARRKTIKPDFFHYFLIHHVIAAFNTDIRRIFQARLTHCHSIRTLFNPRRRNCRKTMVCLMVPSSNRSAPFCQEYILVPCKRNDDQAGTRHTKILLFVFSLDVQVFCPLTLQHKYDLQTNQQVESCAAFWKTQIPGFDRFCDFKLFKQLRVKDKKTWTSSFRYRRWFLSFSSNEKFALGRC